MTHARVSCGVIVTDGRHVLLGHATRSPRWDIPKGLAEPGETYLEAAVRELKEETGLVIATRDLSDLGIHHYLPGKDLALAFWRPARMPDPDTLICASTFIAGGAALPEFDRFGIFPWEEAFQRVGKNMSRVLRALVTGGAIAE